MIGVASSLQGQGSGSPASGVGRLPPDDRLSRVAHRRHTYAVQVASYALGAAVLLPYAHVGTITMVIPAAYLVSGVSLIGLFAGLSETRFNDRFEDHYLTVAQVIGHLIVQLGFLIAAPQIGYAFLNVLFLIYGVAALRMTPRQAVLVWMLTAAAVAAIFLRTEMPIGMPSATPAERLAAALCFVVTIGQCAFVGLYGDSLRKKLYRRGVELSEAYERIEELAELDELTGSFNRRCIMRSLEDEIARAHRSQIPCSVALIDLDWFKRINDVYGHPIGDEVLRTFAICMYANIRGVDRLGRYGGEEFLMVLPGTSHEVAARMLDRLREIIANLDWSAFSSSMQVTISAGLVTLRPDETSESLLARADHALYQAKAGGRNRIAAA